MKIITRATCGMLLVMASYNVQAQEALVDRVHIYKKETGIVYRNEAFHINQQNGPVQITGVAVRHIPRKTAVLADSYYDALFRYLKKPEKQRLRKLAKETLTITIDAKGQNIVAVKFGIVVYDAFKEFLGGLTGITMDAPTTSYGQKLVTGLRVKAAYRGGDRASTSPTKE